MLNVQAARESRSGVQKRSAFVFVNALRPGFLRGERNRLVVVVGRAFFSDLLGVKETL